MVTSVALATWVAGMAGGSGLGMAAFVGALPVVAERPLATAYSRRGVAAGGVSEPSVAVAAGGSLRRSRGVSMVAASKGPTGGTKPDASSGKPVVTGKPVVNDSYISVPTERIRNLSIIAHIDHGTYGAWWWWNDAGGVCDLVGGMAACCPPWHLFVFSVWFMRLGLFASSAVSLAPFSARRFWAPPWACGWTRA